MSIAKTNIDWTFTILKKRALLGEAFQKILIASLLGDMIRSISSKEIATIDLTIDDSESSMVTQGVFGKAGVGALRS